MKRIMSNSYIVLLLVLGGITTTSVMAMTPEFPQTISVRPLTTNTVTYPYAVTNGVTQSILVGTQGFVAIGNVSSTHPVNGLLDIFQPSDTAVSGILIQNHLQTGSMRYWEDTLNNGHITGGGGVDKIIISSTPPVVYIPAGNTFGIGVTTPTQALDVAGGVHLTGNMTSTPANELTISTTNSKDICIGSC